MWWFFLFVASVLLFVLRLGVFVRVFSFGFFRVGFFLWRLGFFLFVCCLIGFF